MADLTAFRNQRPHSGTAMPRAPGARFALVAERPQNAGRALRQMRGRSPLSRLAIGAAAAYVAALPLLRPSGPFNTSPVDLPGFVLVAAAALAVFSGRLALKLPYAAPIAVFALGGTLGALAGPVPGSGLLAVAQDLILLVVCGAIASIGAAARVRTLLLRTWAVSGLVWACLLIIGVIGHISALAGGGQRYGVRATLTMGDPNVAGNYFVASLFVLYIARWPHRLGRRLLATGVVVVAVLLTGSNGAVVALVVGALAAGATNFCLRRNWPVVVGLGAVAAAALLFLSLAPVTRWQHELGTAAHNSSSPIVRDSFGREQQSLSTRETLVGESFRLFRTGGVLGSGPGSTKPRLEAEQYPYPKEAHDDYLAALIERGPIGVFGLVLLLVAVVWQLRALLRKHRARLMVRSIGPPSAVVACALVFMTSGMFYEVLHFRHLWVFLALLAAMSGERVP